MDPILMSVETAALSSGSMIKLRGNYITTPCGDGLQCGGICIKNNAAATENGVCVVISSLTGTVTKLNPVLSFAATLTPALFVDGTKFVADTSGVLTDPILAAYSPEVNWNTTAS